MPIVKDVYDLLDEVMPFSTQEKWDNSGLVVGDMYADVSCVLTCLDITREVIMEAKDIGAELIVSHHPVIFDPLKRIETQTAVYDLVKYGISAVCCHTNGDISDCGTNAKAYSMLEKALGLKDRNGFEMTDGGYLGWTAKCEPSTPVQLAKKLKSVYADAPIRYNNPRSIITKVAFCSGSGASLLEYSAELGCDALITGDVKHDRFVMASDMNMALFDCTHYATEVPFAEAAAQLIGDRFDDIKAVQSVRGRNFIHVE